MKHPERAEDYLEHISEAIERATGYLQELDNLVALQSDHKTQAAVIATSRSLARPRGKFSSKRPNL